RLTTAIENALKLKVEKDKSRQTEEALRESEERFRSYVDYAPHGVFVADKNGNYLDANSAASKITGYSKEELLMMNLIDLTAPESLEITGDHFNKTVNEGFASGEIAFIRKDGSKGFWTVDTVKLSKDRFLGFVVDVTERRQAEEAIKESEEKLRNIFENSTNLFYSHTPDNLITYTSPQVKNILGYTQEEAMIKWTELTSDNPRNEIGLKHTARTIETGKQQPTYELELVKKSGEKVCVEVREAPVVKDGKTVSIVGALTDITERKQKERELIAKIKQLEMFNEITVDREIEINETRKEVNELLKQMGKAPKYIVVE
nr:PAS domain-containing protein [Candidatus Cloacimonadota bacterium]